MLNTEANCLFHREAGEFYYDKVFGMESNNREVYSELVAPVVKKALDGYNGTVFAYGMTGSGKTYSMQGESNEMGLIDLCVDQIFRHYTTTAQMGAINKVSCSYLEIYNERLYDLLNPEATRYSSLGRHSAPPPEELRIRDDPQFGVKVIGLNEVGVTSAESLVEIISKGDTLRRTSTTDFNARSSRSHAIVLLRLSSKNAPDAPEHVSTLCLCDLAGSEKATLQVERRQEGSFINKSLLALGTVIAKLSKGTTGHIPYRDSKLTRLLQPSLSGNAVISVLCTIHLSSQTFAETVNTLRFASRAKNIAYNVHRIESTEKGSYSDKFVENLIKENEQLRKRVKLSEGQPTSGTENEQIAEVVAENKILSEQLEHQKRLNEERVMEQVMENNEAIQHLLQYTSDPRCQQCVLALEQFGRTSLGRIEEMQSYIMHLEQQLNNKEYAKTLQTVNENQNTSTQRRDEIDELKQSLKSKDTIIKALKSAKNMRDIFDECNRDDLENMPPPLGMPLSKLRNI